ncbi:helix-turn-helix transcriptional regulator, partial [Bacteroidota bacterium]
KDSHKILEYVSFDDSKNFKGIDNLKHLLLATKENREISFLHENYNKKTKEVHTITPLILKEYLNRWYIVGVTKEKDEIRTYGIDRLSNIEILNPSNINRAAYKEKLQKFEHTVGLTYGEGQPEKVCLLINELHVKYLKSLPLHSSQVVFPKNEDNKHRVEYYLYPNYEFITQILKIGIEAEVVAPPHLRTEVKNILKRTLQNYDS